MVVAFSFHATAYSTLSVYNIQFNICKTLQVPVSKLMMLVAAKWRLFCETNPHLSSGNSAAMGSEENTNTSTASDYAAKPRPGRPPKEPKVRVRAFCLNLVMKSVLNCCIVMLNFRPCLSQPEVKFQAKLKVKW